MRRSEREITDSAVLDGILRSAQILFLALRDEPAPYVIPVCYGMEEGILYVHSALVGTKIDLIQRQPVVGFSACTEMIVTPGAAACDFTAAAQSVVGTGRARIAESEEERLRGLDSIMRHYANRPPGDPTYRPGPLSRTCVIAVTIDTLRGKDIGELPKTASSQARSE